MSAVAAARTHRTRIVLLTLLGVAVMGGLAAWWLHTHERVERVVAMPRIGEARRNPLYALQVALQKDGVPVQSRRRLQLLPEGRRATVTPGLRDTVVVYNDPRTLTHDEADELLRWVNRGGHLVVRTPPMGLLASNAPVPLFAELQLVPMGRGHDGCEEVRGAPAARSSRAAASAAGEDAQAFAGDLLFCGARRFTLAGANPSHSWGDLKNGYVFARLPYGNGSVDVLADLDFLSSDELEQPAHHELARQVLQPNHRAGTVHLVYAAQMPSLWSTLARYSWMAWGPLLLALAFWLWRRMQRFGPLLAPPPGERRSLLEHITASGELTYRYGYGHLLYDAVRSAFLARLRRRDPVAAALQGEAQLQLLAARFRDVPMAELRDALRPPALPMGAVNDHAAFRTRIALLIRLRNRL